MSGSALWRCPKKDRRWLQTVSDKNGCPVLCGSVSRRWWQILTNESSGCAYGTTQRVDVLIDKITVRVCQLPPGQLEAFAADRLVWRDVCKDGLATFSINYDQETEGGFVATPSPRRRQPAHVVASVTEPMPPTSYCAVIYASTIVHPQFIASTASSSTSSDKQAKQSTANQRKKHNVEKYIRLLYYDCSLSRSTEHPAIST